MPARYELYYWPSIQGRGEFIRLALEDAGASYVDVARNGADGMATMMRLMGSGQVAEPPFAPPFLKSGKLLIAQTANILLYLGPRLGLVPASERSRLFAHQLQLTITDLVQEVHDTHHPISTELYYEEQRRAAKQRAAAFLEHRAPKFLGYFERVLARNTGGKGFAIGARLTYPDLSLFQIIAGLRYAFPKGMARIERDHPRLVALHDKVATRPRIAAYLASPRRLPFSEEGIFRHYPALDAKD
jgi:glutathione S-transferase